MNQKMKVYIPNANSVLHFFSKLKSFSRLGLLFGLSLTLYSCDYDGETLFRIVNASEEDLRVAFQNQGQNINLIVPAGETDTIVSIIDLAPLRDLDENFLEIGDIQDLIILPTNDQLELKLDPLLRANWVYSVNPTGMFKKSGDDIFSFEVVPDDVD